ncbi:AAA family ATPase [Vibrio breoganii]
MELGLGQEQAQVTKRFGEMFRCKGMPAGVANVSLLLGNGERSGKVVSNYYFEWESLARAFAYIHYGLARPLFLFGSHGTGKTSLPEQISARLGRNFSKVTVGPSTEAFELVAQRVPSADGGMTTELGLLAKAMEQGDVFIIDEYDLMPTAEQKNLNDICENGVVYLPDGRIIRSHKDFRIFATANTNNTEDNLDLSVNDRFAFMRMDYLPADVESELAYEHWMQLHSVFSNGSKADWKNHVSPQLDELVRSRVNVMIKVAEGIRENKAENDDSFFSTMSIRAIFGWIDELMLARRFDLNRVDNDEHEMLQALRRAFINGLPIEEQEEIVQLFQLKSDLKSIM